MAEIQVEQRFDCSVTAAWDLLTEVARYPERVGSYERVEFQGSQREGPGTRWRQTRTVFGRSHSQEIEVVACGAPRTFAHQAREAGALYETRYELAVVDGATRVVMTFSVRATNPIAGLFVKTIGRRMLRGTGEAMAKDLADLAAVANGS